jgi:hypothetical protein
MVCAARWFDGLAELTMESFRLRSRTCLTVGALFALALGAAPAHAALDVAWDCYLPNGQLSCDQLAQAFFSNRAFARAPGDAADPGNAAGPDTSIHVRAIDSADGTTYSIDVHGKDGSSFSFADRIPHTFSSDAVLLRLVGDVQKSTAHLFTVDEPGTTDDGVLRLELRDPDAGPRQARKDDTQTGWYLAPSLSANANQSAVTELSVRGGLEANWSHPAWRLHGYAWGNYRYVHLDDGTDDPEDTYQNLDLGTDWTVVRTVAGGFALGANGYVMHEPQENYQLRGGTLIGAEWMYAPFLKTDEANFGVRYEIGADHEEYVYETVRLKHSDNFMRHRVRVFGAWHFSRVDLNGGLTAQSLLTNLDYSSISANGGVTWRILDDLSLSFNGEVSYRNGLVNEPKDLSQLPPLAAFYGGSSYGDVTYWSWISLEYVFGNSLILRQDQRWR